MSDSEPGEIHSPEISSVVRAKRIIEERRHHKSDKKIRLERDTREEIRRDDREEVRREDPRRGEDSRRDDMRREEVRREELRRGEELRREEKRTERLREEDKARLKEEKRREENRLREKARLKEEEKVRRKEEERVRLKEEKVREEARIKEEEKEELKRLADEKALEEKKERKLSEKKEKKKEKRDIKESPEKKKEVEKKKKKSEKDGKKVKHVKHISEQYERLLQDRLGGSGSNSVTHSPEEVSLPGTQEPLKKRSVLEDTDTESSEQDMSDEEMADLESMEQARKRTPTPSPPPDPLAGLPPYFPALQGCRNVEHFEWLNKIDEGTYGVVYRARDKRTNETVALKKLKMEKEKQGFPITSLREINTLLKGQHENVVHVREIVVGSNMDKIYIVMDYVEHDLKCLMENMKQPFLIGEVKTIMRQLCAGLSFLHDNWIIHRDIKTSNLLFSHAGILKIGDFGLAREYGSPLKQYTEIVVTLWYRAPELLLGCKLYSVPIDVWSAGCVMGELLGQKPLFPGKSEIDQLNKIFKELGTPNEKIWPGWSLLPATKKVTFTEHPYNQLRNRFPATYLTEEGFKLLNALLAYDPSRRITAAASLSHPWFREAPLPVDPSMFPTWPAKSEMMANPAKKKQKSPTPPEGGGMAAELQDSGFKFLTAMQGSSAKGPGFSLKF